jgi:hypothetical protein
MKWSLSFLALLSLSAAPAEAQWRVDVGGGYVMEQDTFTAPCGCRFADGRGYAIEAGVSYDIYSELGLTIGVRIGGDFTAFHSAHYYGIVRDSAHFELLYLSLAPFVRYQIPALGLFVQAAPSLNYLASSYMYQRWRRTDGTLWGNGSIDTLQEDNPLIDPTKTNISARVSVGSNFELFDREFSPLVTANIPVTTNESANRSGTATSNWSLLRLYLSLAIKL